MVVTACSGSGGSEAARSESRPTNTKPAETGEVSPAMPSVAHRLRRGSVEAAACTLPHEWLLRIWRGYRPDRGAEIQMLPHEFDFVGSGLPHVGPWPSVQDVPMLWYGPGHIRARQQDITDLQRRGAHPPIYAWTDITYLMQKKGITWAYYASQSLCGLEVPVKVCESSGATPAQHPLPALPTCTRPSRSGR